ncbi:deoxyribodipyrimidine photolyase-like uncharacterized protein [Filimonas zeae]|uniref:Uncharacterized protein n=1 Tax=Filimonas zeae TaxID=1737353 RepID=A0A917IRG9_9BACT|nr:hypothetical protein [Filimonas zeae]MDR6338208.1 deoxyribodipyrimidine photolyase-like uncharacterized protein [Filimonas zeae]GGH62250.1 hypothetical protein GCM10011379_12040 [Filimonas zeae]
MKTVYCAVIAVLVSLVSVNTSKANNNKDKETVAIAEKQVSVTYTGYNDNSVVFRVAFENPTAQKFSLIIKNEAGDVLYQGSYSDTSFSKAVHLLKEDSEMNPTFIIRVGSQRIERTFKVNSTSSSTEEVVVVKQ